MATHSRILSWRIPWTEEPDKLESVGSQRVGHDSAHAYTHIRRSWCFRCSLYRHRDTGTPVFITALFTIAETWKQP